MHATSEELRKLLAKLDPTHPVGIRSPKAKRSASSAVGSKSVSVPCYDLYCEMKAKYPRCMVLVQV